MITTFEQAKKLKELGFNYKTTAYYVDGSLDYNSPINWNTNEGLDNDGNEEEEDGYCSAPTVSDALQWIRDKYQSKGLFLSVGYEHGNRYYYFGAMFDAFKRYELSTDNYPTFPEAESKLLTVALEYLETKQND